MRQVADQILVGKYPLRFVPIDLRGQEVRELGLTPLQQVQGQVQQQVQALVAAEKLALTPVKLGFVDILMNMVFSGAFYAPISGLGGAFAVLRLKRKAVRE